MYSSELDDGHIAAVLSDWPRYQGKIFGRPGKNVCIRDSDMYE